MQPARTKSAILFAALLVFGALSISNYVGWLRLKPEVSAIAWIEGKAGFDDHVVNIHQRATRRVQIGAPDALLPIYDIQNPGFFLLVAELFVRAGATTSFPLQIASMVLFNVGAICFFFWVCVLFDSAMVAAFSTAFLALSQFFLFFPGVTHTFPYEFVFFNITMLLFVLFLKNGRKGFLAASLLAMFMTCMNYWFYYMSSWIIMVGLWWQYRGRPRIRDVAIISAPPVAAAFFTAVMVMSLFGGVRSGGLRLLDIFVARTIDARMPGGSWYPDQRFMSAADWFAYPSLVMERLQWAYTINRWFAVAAGCTFLLLWFRNKRSVVSALILLVGGFSWYYVMFQHTYIHWFTGQYSFMAICPIFGLIVSETTTFVRSGLRRLAAARSVPLAHPERLLALNCASLHVAAAVLVLTASSLLIWPYLKKTYGLIQETISLSQMVEAKYQQAVQDICRQRSEVTLADLQLAAKDWGFDWHPELIAGTNRLPKCSG
jgi:hypothetical protein